MKLILNCSILFGKFFPYFMLPLLHRGCCIEFIMFWERIRGEGNAMKAIARWAGFGSQQGFSGSALRQGSLCCDLVFKFHAGTMS